MGDFPHLLDHLAGASLQHSHMTTRVHVLILIIVPVMVAGVFAGCTSARMPVDESLADGEYWVVEGRQGWKIRERLSFGPYTADSIDRSWTKGRGLVINELELNRRRQTFSFTLAGNGAPLYSVECGVRLRHGEINTPIVDVQFRNRSEMDCTANPIEQDRSAWTLALEERGERPLTGTLSTQGSTFEIAGTNKLRGGLPASFTTGYYVRLNGRDIGSVEVVNAGGVRIGAAVSDDDREVIAAAAAALLLLEDLRATIEEV